MGTGGSKFGRSKEGGVETEWQPGGKVKRRRGRKLGQDPERIVRIYQPPIQVAAVTGAGAGCYVSRNPGVTWSTKQERINTDYYVKDYKVLDATNVSKSNPLREGAVYHVSKPPDARENRIFFIKPKVLPYGLTPTSTEPSALHFGDPDDGLDEIPNLGRYVAQGPVQEAADAVLEAHSAKVLAEMNKSEEDLKKEEEDTESEKLPYPGWKPPRASVVEKAEAAAVNMHLASTTETATADGDENGEVQISMSSSAKDAHEAAEAGAEQSDDEGHAGVHGSNIALTPEQQAMLEAAKTANAAQPADAADGGASVVCADGEANQDSLTDKQTPMSGGLNALLGGMDPLTPGKVPSSWDHGGAAEDAGEEGGIGAQQAPVKPPPAKGIKEAAEEADAAEGGAETQNENAAKPDAEESDAPSSDSGEDEDGNDTAVLPAAAKAAPPPKELSAAELKRKELKDQMAALTSTAKGPVKAAPVPDAPAPAAPAAPALNKDREPTPSDTSSGGGRKTSSALEAEAVAAEAAAEVRAEIAAETAAEMAAKGKPDIEQNAPAPTEPEPAPAQEPEAAIETEPALAKEPEAAKETEPAPAPGKDAQQSTSETDSGIETKTPSAVDAETVAAEVEPVAEARESEPTPTKAGGGGERKTSSALEAEAVAAEAAAEVRAEIAAETATEMAASTQSDQEATNPRELV